MVKFLRLVVLTSVVVSWQVTPALAESLLQSGARLARQAGQQVPVVVRADVRRSAVAEQAPAAENGMSKRKKLFIAIGAFVAAAAGIYAIDRGVEDNTPSTKGTRAD